MNGIVNLLKPPGMSSNGAVGFFKKTLNFKKIGHAGTLDPGASGVLVVLVGKATKLSDRLMNGDKAYIGEITFGVKTDTQDSYGEVLETDDKIVSYEQINSVLGEFVGEIEQTPSRYSAIKINGQKAYKMARKGQDFTIKSRKITIHSLKLLHQSDENRFLLEVQCSKGTYIRALFEDIGKRLETLAYMSFLERTRSGSYSVNKAFTCDEIQKLVAENRMDEFLIDCDDALSDLPCVIVEDYDYKKISNGLQATIKSIDSENPSEEYRVYCKGDFFGIGNIIDRKVKLDTHLLGD